MADAKNVDAMQAQIDALQAKVLEQEEAINAAPMQNQTQKDFTAKEIKHGKVTFLIPYPKVSIVIGGNVKEYSVAELEKSKEALDALEKMGAFLSE